MTIALIINFPQTVASIFGDVPNPMRLPNGDIVNGAQVGWTSQDGVYSLVAVTPFITPSGQVNVGAASYTVDGGVVTETYATQAAPAPIYAAQVWQIKAVLTSAQLTAVEAAINASPSADVLNAFWLTGDEPVPSNSITLQALGAEIGMTPAQVTALVEAASQVVIP
jgi:hypothetical protein